jgi:hypothetical protein
MNIVILNGNPDSTNNTFERYLDLYRVKLHKAGHYVRSFLLREMQINDFRSDSQEEKVYRESPEDDFRYISNALQETDLLVTASPLEKGNITGLSKTVQDRLSRVLMPPARIPAPVKGSYSDMQKKPLMGLIFQTEPGTSEHDLLLNRLIGERMAANLQTVMSFSTTMESDVTDTLCKTFQSMDYHTYVEKTFQDLISGSTLQG